MNRKSLRERKIRFRHLLNTIGDITENTDGMTHSKEYVSRVIQAVAECGSPQRGRTLLEADPNLTSTDVGLLLVQVARMLVEDAQLNPFFIDAELIEDVPVFHFEPATRSDSDKAMVARLKECGDPLVLARPGDEIFKGTYSDYYVISVDNLKFDDGTQVTESHNRKYESWTNRLNFWLGKLDEGTAEDYDIDFRDAFKRGVPARDAALHAVIEKDIVSPEFKSLLNNSDGESASGAVAQDAAFKHNPKMKQKLHRMMKRRGGATGKGKCKKGPMREGAAEKYLLPPVGHGANDIAKGLSTIDEDVDTLFKLAVTLTSKQEEDLIEAFTSAGMDPSAIKTALLGKVLTNGIKDRPTLSEEERAVVNRLISDMASGK